MVRTRGLILVPFLGLLFIPLGVGQGGEETAMGELTKEELRWLARLPNDDRDAVNRACGWAVPEFPKDAKWIGGSGPSLESLRGKVVLIQTFATHGPGRAAMLRLNRAIKPIQDQTDFVAIAVHTPEDVGRLDALLPRLKIEVPLLVDAGGNWCDHVGAFRKPVSYLVDRQGNVRYAGVSAKSIEKAARKLLEETYDAETLPRNRPNKPNESKIGTQFPVFKAAVGSATDRRQQRAVDFYVEEIWKQPIGEATGKVVVLEFWATWCGPCRKVIPHMNEIQNHYGDEVICLSISDESNFDRAMAKRGLKANDFAYGLAVDTTSRLMGWFGVRGIPHAVVLGGDWVVRWQGHPARLNHDILDSIVNANRFYQRKIGTMPGDPPPRRWQFWIETQAKHNG